MNKSFTQILNLVHNGRFNYSNSIRFIKSGSQPFMRMVRKIKMARPDVSNEQFENAFIDTFADINEQLLFIPTIKVDTLRYNACKDIVANHMNYSALYNDALETISSIVKRGEITESDFFYTSNSKQASKNMLMETIIEREKLRRQKEAEDPEYYKKLQLLFNGANAKTINAIKNRLDSKSRRRFEEDRKLFDRSKEKEYIYEYLRDEKEPTLRKELKGKYVDSLMFLGNILNEFDIYDFLIALQSSTIKRLDLDYKISSDEEKTLGVKDLFNREVLESLSIMELSALNSFWINRFIKETQSMSETFFITKQLNLWDRIISAREDSFGRVKLPTFDRNIGNLCEKRAIIRVIDDLILDNNEENGRGEVIANLDNSIFESNDSVVHKVDVDTLMKSVQSAIGEDYRMYFKSKGLQGKHDILTDIDDCQQADNAIYNAYRYKDLNLIATLSNIVHDENIENWGIILEKGKKITDAKMILIACDIQGLNMPLRLHINKDMLMDFLRASKQTSLIPIYEGAQDFLDFRGKNISTQVLMPLSAMQKERIKVLDEVTSVNNPDKNFIEHLLYLVDRKRYPRHLMQERYNKSKKKIQFRKKPKEYVDLEDGKEYIENYKGKIEEKPISVEEKEGI